MEIFGYFAALLVGVAMGLIGGGGSILTVPLLVYLFGLTPLLATSYSLFVVGSTSLVGALNSFRKGLVHLEAVALFGSSSLVTVFVSRRFLVPSIPEELFHVGSFTLTFSLLTMVLFAVLMLLASLSMIRGRKKDAAEEDSARYSLKTLLGHGVGIGLITGLLGAGGGFLLIPALVLLLRLPMKMAVGTSLLIIALNSLIGFAGDLGHVAIEWSFLLRITAIAIAGIFFGGALGKKIPGERLKKGFGWFVLLMGTYILIHETIMK
ncbi:MAG: sulfite exporter TauE/SafE family protein [Chitinophagaceae bacterium]|nr:MAG: sulfite exporter TauE/SafE family protein [Chitinophagaceae bacterium]